MMHSALDIIYWATVKSPNIYNFIFSLISLFLKNKMRLMRSLCCLCVPFQIFRFYEVHVISKKSRQLILPRTSCCYWSSTEGRIYKTEIYNGEYYWNNLLIFCYITCIPLMFVR
jgi:hypothetical protein